METATQRPKLLSELAKLRKATVSIVTPVCLSVYLFVRIERLGFH
jgi:hypothetical protein